jgi:transposase
VRAGPHPAGPATAAGLPERATRLAQNPRVALHFTPTGCSWLNMVEIFFSIITRQAIRRGTYRSVKDLTARIGEFIDGWNERCQPFVWTKPAAVEILCSEQGAHILG